VGRRTTHPTFEPSRLTADQESLDSNLNSPLGLSETPIYGRHRTQVRDSGLVVHVDARRTAPNTTGGIPDAPKSGTCGVRIRSEDTEEPGRGREVRERITGYPHLHGCRRRAVTRLAHCGQVNVSDWGVNTSCAGLKGRLQGYSDPELGHGAAGARFVNVPKAASPRTRQRLRRCSGRRTRRRG
jgi:hypothetical protein